ncbi:MAG: SoxR reducing system RseC family protein [Desulfobacteraceae bacterium]|nr:SoxR reducing system RseC family protein [Desulfobacteraceae bacterium]
MAIEQGIVVELGSEGKKTAWVETVRSAACESCKSRASCHGIDKNKAKVEAINEVDAKVGDRIQIAISTSSLLKATFLLYVFPVLCMVLGALGAHALVADSTMDTSNITIVSALTCFGIALVVVRIGGNKLAQKASYQPKIIRILGHNNK